MLKDSYINFNKCNKIFAIIIGKTQEGRQNWRKARICNSTNQLHDLINYMIYFKRTSLLQIKQDL